MCIKCKENVRCAFISTYWSKENIFYCTHVQHTVDFSRCLRKYFMLARFFSDVLCRHDTLFVITVGSHKFKQLFGFSFIAFLQALYSHIGRWRMLKKPWLFRKELHTRRTAPPTCPTMAVLKTALQGLLMCVKYRSWHKWYWQTWLDIWGSELPAYLMHIHLLYPTGLARAPQLCHLATLRLPRKCIVTLIMQICILFSSYTCIRSLLLYWSWDTGLTERNQGECRFFFL